MRTDYYAVIGNRDHIKMHKGTPEEEKRPFWEYLDRMPDGWLTSLVYHRDDVPTDRPQIWDCGAWSYKNEAVPPVTPEGVYADYETSAAPGSLVIAPDHMLIEGTDLPTRRAFNAKSAADFLALSRKDAKFRPMAAVHGMDLAERVEHTRRVLDMGYDAIAVGGVAARASQKSSVLEMVEAIRDESRGAHLHVLGLTSPNYMEEWGRIGVDSADGSSHFKQAFTGGTFFVQEGTRLVKHQAARTDRKTGEVIGDVPDVRCDCTACARLRDEEGIDTRTYGSNEHNMGRAAHNLNMLMRAHACIGARTVALVACAAGKGPSPAPARDLYRSALFSKARTYAERMGDEWHVLSALHGLLDPDDLVAPYERTLNDASADERRAWGRQVAGSILRRYPDTTRFVVLAGRHYRDHLVPILEAAGHVCEVPMLGLGIGQQLAWLAEHTDDQLHLNL